MYDKMFEMKSLSWAGMKKNPAIIPIIVIMGIGGSWATYYLCRLAIRNPDVTWRRKTNPEPWQEYENKQYKFFNFSGFDYENYKHPRPRF